MVSGESFMWAARRTAVITGRRLMFHVVGVEVRRVGWRRVLGTVRRALLLQVIPVDVGKERVLLELLHPAAGAESFGTIANEPGQRKWC